MNKPLSSDDRQRALSGVLLMDKPAGLSSHDVALRLRRLFGVRRIGHTGTLDPLATGLLVFCIGSATKLVRFLTEADKSYEAVIHLGVKSKTYDAEGVDPDLAPADISYITEKDIRQELLNFEGAIEQKPPIYSAIRVDGRRLYKAARAGEQVTLPSRAVTVHSLSLTEYSAPLAKVSVDCGKGFYVRSLAHDLGENLGCGAHLSGLRRTRVGRFDLDEAHTLEELASLVDSNPEGLSSCLIAPERALNMPALVVTDSFAPRVITGVIPTVHDIQSVSESFAAGAQVTLSDSAGKMLAVGICSVDSADLRHTSEASSLAESFYRHVRVI